jgi:hypothetical protein
MILRGLREILGSVIAAPFQLSDVSTFPDSEFSVNRARYLEYWNWFQGIPLNEKQTQNGKVVERFPLHVNPIPGMVIKHSYALFGEFKEDSRPLVLPYLKPNKKEQKEAAQYAQNMLNLIWWENSGRTLMMRNALLSQIMGGCVFKVSYVPDDRYRSIPLMLESIAPTNFIGFPVSGDEYRLKEAWIVKAITYKDAAEYGITIAPDQEAYYIEHWTEEYVEYKINGYSIPTGTTDINGMPVYFGGKNIYGFIPIVYIPHYRVQGFYGQSHITPALKGIIYELNARLADLGDASADDSHRYYFMRNTNGLPEVIELAPGLRVINGGTNPNVTGKEGQPDITEIGGQRLTGPMREFIETLMMQFRRESSIPAVSDGEDEGSQRSSLTLAMRMWPLMSHTKGERVFWTDALNVLTRIILKMCIVKNLIPDLSPEVLGMRVEQRWAPLMPRDRQEFVNELVTRAASNLGSLEHLMELTDDIEDPSEELEKIKEWLKIVADIQAEADLKANPPVSNTQRPSSKSKTSAKAKSSD